MDRRFTTLPFTESEVADGNFSTEREPITGIILHTTVSSLPSARQTFDTVGTKRSAHYIVGLDGSLTACLEEYNTAFQAGNWPINLSTIGIEHEDNGDYNGTRPDALYETSAKLVADICTFYKIPIDRQHIFKHAEVIDKTYYPGGTQCPDSLDVDRIVQMAYTLVHIAPVAVVSPQTSLDTLRLERDTNYNLLVSVLNALGIFLTDSLDKFQGTKQAITQIGTTQTALQEALARNHDLEAKPQASTQPQMVVSTDPTQQSLPQQAKQTGSFSILAFIKSLLSEKGGGK